MKTRIKYIFLAIITLSFIISCSDDITKMEDADKYPRIEFSNCTACYDCIEDFNCPQQAIRIDEQTGKVYIDQERCIRCYDCINAFSCDYNAITRQEDIIAPAQPQNITAISDSIGIIDINFTAPGDDSLSGIAYLYELQIVDQNNQFINTDFIPTMPRYSGFPESWHITGMPENDTLTVRIRAYDEVGLSSEYNTAEVVVKGEYIDTTAPSAIEDLTAISEEYSITLSWTAPFDADPRANAVSYQIRQHTQAIDINNWDQAIEVEHDIVPADAGSIEQLILNYTLPSGYLYFAVRSTDAAGNMSLLSNNASGEATTDITAPAGITDLSAGQPGNTSVPLSWTAPGDNGMEGIASSYEIRISGEEITADNWIDCEIIDQAIIPQPAGSYEVYSISNLIPETEYYFAIKAVDDAANISLLSNYAHTITEATPDTEAPAPITDLSSSINGLDIVLTWTATGDDGANGTAESYQLFYADQEISETNLDNAMEIAGLPYPQQSGTTEEFIISELQQGSEWFFVIRASDEAGNESELSNNTSALIPFDEIPPAVITDLTAEVVDTSILLTWTATGDDGLEGTAAAYDLRMANEVITEANWNNCTELTTTAPGPAGTEEELLIEEPEYNITWYFAIKAIDDEDNISDLSDNCAAIIEYELDTTPPAAITDITVDDGASSYNNRITINWTATGDDGDTGTATAYEIRYSTSPISETNWNSAQLFNAPPVPGAAGSSESCAITGLNPGTVYYFGVRAVDEADNMGGMSNSIGGKIVYQILASQCHDCNSCIWRCDQNAIYDAGSYKAINPDLCIACGECLVCPFNAIRLWVIEY